LEVDLDADRDDILRHQSILNGAFDHAIARAAFAGELDMLVRDLN
jgi:hypothetical protein